MTATTLAAAAVIHLVTAASFMLVGRAVYRTRVADTHGALRALTWWWWGLAMYLAIQALVLVAAALDILSLGLFAASRVLVIPLITGGAGALTYYMLYLFTGRAAFGWPVAILYCAAAATFYVATFVPTPTSLAFSNWVVTFGGPGNPRLENIVYFLVGVPPIASSIALLATAHRLDAPQRYRATLVGLAILAYVGGGLVAFLGTDQLFQFIALTVFGLFASISVLLAYYPPLRIRTWLGIEQDDVLKALAKEREERRQRFAFRLRGLV